MAIQLWRILLLIIAASFASLPSEVAPEESSAAIGFDEYLQLLRQNPNQYEFEYGTLSDGDEFYCLKGELSTECRATVMAFAKMSQNWTSYPDVYFALFLNRLKDPTKSEHPFESVCPFIEEKIQKLSKVIVDDFTRLKEAFKSEKVAKPKCYFDKLLRTVEEVEAATNRIYQIPGLAEFLANEEFRKQRYPEVAYSKDTYIVAKSVQTVANKSEYKARVQQIYDEVIAETTKIIAKITSQRDMHLIDTKSHTHTLTFLPPMIQMLQKRIEEDSVLKPEFENSKKLVAISL